MNPFTGDSYKYFNGGRNLGNPGRFNRPVFSNAPAVPWWRQSHPNGPTERELQALSSSTLAIWQLPNGSESTATASTGYRRAEPKQGNVLDPVGKILPPRKL